MRNVIHEKSYTKCDQETISRPYSKKKQIKHISKLGLSKYIETKPQTTCFYLM